MRKWGKRRRESLRRVGPSLAAAVGLAAVVALTVVQLDQGPPDSTTLALVGVGVPLLFGLLAPAETGDFLRRITSFKVAGVVEVGMETVVRAESVRPPGDEGDGIVAAREGQDYKAIVVELRKRIRFVHAITDLKDEIEREDAYELIVHTLAAERLLDEDKTRFALDLLSGRDWGLSELPRRAREEFLDAAWSFATRFHFGVWDRYVRSELTKQGWVIADYPQEPGHRKDFLACWQGRWALMTARVGGSSKPWRYPASRRRLAKTKQKTKIEGWCIVIPGGDRSATVISKKGTGGRSKVKVLKLQGSLRENPERAFRDSDWNQDALR